ncbi:MAG: single-stranded DNA-binding protein [Spirochaetia bacterium]
MNPMNSLVIEGNLVRDPMLRTTAKGTPVCNFTVATNRYYKKEDEMVKEVNFFDVEVWSKIAENCAKNLAKGLGVKIEGRLKQDRWVDDEGKPHNRTKIVGNHVELKMNFGGKKKEEEREKEEVNV